jgi:hypothetical protein
MLRRAFSFLILIAGDGGFQSEMDELAAVCIENRIDSDQVNNACIMIHCWRRLWPVVFLGNDIQRTKFSRLRLLAPFFG